VVESAYNDHERAQDITRVVLIGRIGVLEAARALLPFLHRAPSIASQEMPVLFGLSWPGVVVSPWGRFESFGTQMSCPRKTVRLQVGRKSGAISFGQFASEFCLDRNRPVSSVKARLRTTSKSSANRTEHKNLGRVRLGDKPIRAISNINERVLYRAPRSRYWSPISARICILRCGARPRQIHFAAFVVPANRCFCRAAAIHFRADALTMSRPLRCR
jgi:hypothetical protein